MYYLEKQGIYSHGIFWIGPSLEEGVRQANIAAMNDSDAYHVWFVYKYLEPNSQTEYAQDSSAQEVYSKRKYEYRHTLNKKDHIRRELWSWPKTADFKK